MKSITLSLALLSIAVYPLPGMGQEAPWPSRPIRAIVPFGPGAAADTAGRAFLDNISRQLGQPIIVENRPGGGGTVGSAAAARAAPDGYTILVHSNSHVVGKFVYSNLTYDPAQDFVGVTSLVSIEQVFVTSSGNGIKTLRDLVDKALARPNSINYASAGIGSATHLGAERLRIAGGFEATHVPLKATSEAMTEVAAGRLDYFLSPIGLVNPFIKSGQLVALALAGPRRASALPTVPTTGEAGVPNAEYEGWIGMFVPAKTPRPIIDKLNAAVAVALHAPEVQARLDTLVFSPMHMSPEQFAVYLKDDFDRNAQLVKAAGLRPN